jgi:hypothetical protein
LMDADVRVTLGDVCPGELPALFVGRRQRGDNGGNRSGSSGSDSEGAWRDTNGRLDSAEGIRHVIDSAYFRLGMRRYVTQSKLDIQQLCLQQASRSCFLCAGNAGRGRTSDGRVIFFFLRADIVSISIGRSSRPCRMFLRERTDWWIA